MDHSFEEIRAAPLDFLAGRERPDVKRLRGMKPSLCESKMCGNLQS
jgi:hypothetical protein